MNVGIIGTGMMGSQIALRLAQKGHGITVFNRDRSKSEKLRKSGLTVAEQPSEIGHYCDVALICVKDYEAVSDVSFEKNGLIENPNNDLIVLQCSKFLQMNRIKWQIYIQVRGSKWSLSL